MSLPPDAQVETVAPIENIFLRVDPTDPAHEETLRVALLEATELVTRASDALLAARFALLNAGYRDTHPVAKDLDSIAGHLAESARYTRLHPDLWVPLCRNWGWPKDTP